MESSAWELSLDPALGNFPWITSAQDPSRESVLSGDFAGELSLGNFRLTKSTLNLRSGTFIRDMAWDLWLAILSSESLACDLWCWIFGLGSWALELWLRIFDWGSSAWELWLWIYGFGSFVFALASLALDLWLWIFGLESSAWDILCLESWPLKLGEPLGKCRGKCLARAGGTNKLENNKKIIGKW